MVQPEYAAAPVTRGMDTLQVVMWRHYRSSSSAKSPASPSKSGVSRTSSGITSTWEPLSAKKMSEPIQVRVQGIAPCTSSFLTALLFCSLLRVTASGVEF